MHAGRCLITLYLKKFLQLPRYAVEQILAGMHSPAPGGDCYFSLHNLGGLRLRRLRGIEEARKKNKTKDKQRKQKKELFNCRSPFKTPMAKFQLFNSSQQFPGSCKILETTAAGFSPALPDHLPLGQRSHRHKWDEQPYNCRD